MEEKATGFRALAARSRSRGQSGSRGDSGSRGRNSAAAASNASPAVNVKKVNKRDLVEREDYDDLL